MRHALTSLALALVLASAGPAVADPEPRVAATEVAGLGPETVVGNTARATRRRAAITVDGKLDEAAWSDVPVHGGFVQRFPQEGAAPTHQTEFRVVYDDRAIYVGVRAYDDAPDEIRGLLTRRDVQSASDWILIGLDSYHDKRTAFVFGINPAGVQVDRLLFNDFEEDSSWDAVWSGASSVDDRGWVAEVRIPLSQLRFSSDAHQAWGLQIVRSVARLGEESVWSPWPRGSSQVVSRFGTLDDIEGLEPGRRLEVLPYVSGGVATAEVADGDPFHDPTEGRFGLGADVKYGLSNAFTLAATVNPDFGQIEADPSEVNLTAQESFFPEKRPFFLEGTDIFRFGLRTNSDQTENLFYTRRIGAAPHVYAGDYADFADAPSTTTIYGAAKISGKTRSGWSLGVLEAVTAEESAKLAGGDRDALVVEPLTNYAIVRATKDLRGGGTNVGGMVTAVNRRLDGTGLEPLLHDQAYTAGADGVHRFGGNLWSTAVKVWGSYVHGSEEAILEDQLHFRRLYQRPDAGHLGVDPSRTSLAGAGATWDLGRWNHRHWNFGTGGHVRSSGLELNDMGFQRAADEMLNWIWWGYVDNEPGPQVLNWSFGSDLWAVSDTSPEVMFLGWSANLNATLRNYWGVSGGWNLEDGRWNPRLLRGGPKYHAENSWNVYLNLNTDGRKKVSGGTNVWVTRRDESDSWGGGASAWVTYQARSNIEAMIGPNIFINDEDHQYLLETTEMGEDEARYLFARIHQVVAAATVRASWTFSPRLSLQVYAQPFVAAGAYSEYKEAADTYAEDYADRFLVYGRGAVSEMDEEIFIDKDGDGSVEYAFGKPDFNVRELNSNLVLRWEYRPGSTVFLIWSHGRGSFEPVGRFDAGHDLRQLADETGEHVVMVKANYWVGL